MTNHAFVSSSTREGSQHHDAIRHFDGPEHSRLQKEAAIRGLDVQPGIGQWTDGAEETTHLRGPNVHSHAEDLGRQFGQKSVLLFSEHPDGPDRLHFFKGIRNPAKIREHLSEHFTTTPEGTWVVEQEQSPEFLSRAQSLGYPHGHVAGKAVFRETT